MTKSDFLSHACEELIGNGNLEIIDMVFSADYVAHAGDKVHSGHDFIRRFSKQLRSALPDLQVVKVQILTQEGNRVTWIRTLSGTHKANMMGMPPSNKKIVWNEMLVSRFEGDTIVEEWVVSELAGEMMTKVLKD